MNAFVNEPDLIDNLQLPEMFNEQLREIHAFAEAVRSIAVFYDGLVVPGALLLLGSGTWLIAEFFGGWGFLKIPWLVGMIGLFLFEFVEGNTVTRLYFMRLRRLTKQALQSGQFTPELDKARGETVPTFTHFLDLPMLFLIVALGTLKPATWTLFAVGSAIARNRACGEPLITLNLTPCK